MKIIASSPKEYLDQLEPPKKKALAAVRRVIKKNLPEGYKEVMQYGMISYVVPLKLYPDGYLNDKKTPLPYVSLGAQKNHMAIYMSCIYADEKLCSWFQREYAKTGKKLDMGKSCIRFKKIEDIPLDVLGKAVAKISVKKFITIYEKGRSKG